MKEPQNISRNIIYLFFDKVYGAIISLLFLSILTSYLGPELFGVWSYILSFASIAVPLSTAGTNYTIVKKFSLNQNPAEVANQAFLLRLLASITTTIILILAFIVITPKTATQEEIITLTFFLAAMILNNINLSVLYNEYKIKNEKNVLAKNIGLTIGTGIKILLIYNNASISEIAVVTILESLIFFLVGYYLTDLHIVANFSKKVFSDSRKLLSESLPLLFSSVVVIIYLKVDIILLRHFAGIEEVGYYAAAARISEMLYAAPVAISTVFFPVIMKEINFNKETKRNRIRFYAIVFYLCLFLSISCSLLSPQIIQVIYGSSFYDASQILSLHSASIIFIGFLTSSSKELIAKNKYKLIFYRDLAGLFSNLLLNFILIPNYGALGAAVSTLISYFFASVLANLFYKEAKQVLVLMLKSPLIILKKQ
ncbi:flippase [Flavobacteriaceae bacterium]|nr:flippase [Flavobacteriaceae bacterium]